ncbi:glycosyltransferase family 4 protein [Geothrix fermentans]|uniref:glycosyltransferase family 4 protein n=1 Tax=Geothrix fermentans TaxID=44676 RepID=UPI000411BAA9|nr:glycosyltransferase family 4 protein [Geothrix fermentans]
MKILIVTPVFWPEAFRVNDLVSALAEKGHEVEVLAGHPNYPEGRYFKGYHWYGPLGETWAGAVILRFPQIPRGGGQGWRLALQYASFVVGGILRILVHRNWDWDRVFVFQTTPVTAALPGLFAAKLSGAKTIIWVQDIWPDSLEAVGMRFPHIVYRLIEWVSATIYRAFTVVIGQSQAFLPRLQELTVDAGALRCVCNWGDETRPSDVEKGISVWDQGFSILFAGNLGRAQGLASVLEAADQLRNMPGLKWILMGDGVMRTWLLGEIERRGLQGRVILPGRRPSEEMSFHFAEADLLLISLADDPGLARTVPSKLPRYLAAGRPIIGAVAGEPARVIKESGAGVVVEPENVKELAEAIIRMNSMSKEILNAMGQAGRDYYESHFTKNLCVNQLEIILKDA